MKLIAFVLCIVVLTLSIVPCCVIEHKVDPLQKTAYDLKHDQHKDDCCDNCPPFYTCGNCPGFILSKPAIFSMASVHETSAAHTCKYRQPFVKEIALDIWQPPRLG